MVANIETSYQKGVSQRSAAEPSDLNRCAVSCPTNTLLAAPRPSMDPEGTGQRCAGHRCAGHRCAGRRCAGAPCPTLKSAGGSSTV